MYILKGQCHQHIDYRPKDFKDFSATLWQKDPCLKFNRHRENLEIGRESSRGWSELPVSKKCTPGVLCRFTDMTAEVHRIAVKPGRFSPNYSCFSSETKSALRSLSWGFCILCHSSVPVFINHGALSGVL